MDTYCSRSQAREVSIAEHPFHCEGEPCIGGVVTLVVSIRNTLDPDFRIKAALFRDHPKAAIVGIFGTWHTIIATNLASFDRAQLHQSIVDGIPYPLRLQLADVLLAHAYADDHTVSTCCGVRVWTSESGYRSRDVGEAISGLGT